MFCDIFFPLDYFVHPPTMSKHRIGCRRGVPRAKPRGGEDPAFLAQFTGGIRALGPCGVPKALSLDPNSWLPGLRTLPGLLCLALGPCCCVASRTLLATPLVLQKGGPVLSLAGRGTMGLLALICRPQGRLVKLMPCVKQSGLPECLCVPVSPAGLRRRVLVGVWWR